MEEWLAKGKIRKWADGPFHGEHPAGYIPLHAVIKPDKARVVGGAHRQINPRLPPYPFTMSTIEDVEKLLSQGCLLYKLDISDCFMSWQMHPDAQRHLAFQWKDEIYYFVCMPFGLSCAPYFNDLMMRVICAQIKILRILHSNYVDDFILIRLAGQGSGNEHEQVKAIFRSLGINNNFKKESTQWSTQEEYIGYTLDSNTCTTRCTEKRRLQLLEKVVEFLHRHTTRLSDLVSFTGRLVFASTCFPGSKTFYNSLFRFQCKYLHASPTTYVRLPIEVRRDLEIWQTILSTWNNRRVWTEPPRVTIQVTSDASFDGYGFYISEAPARIQSRLPRCLQDMNGCGATYSNHPTCDHACTPAKGGIGWGEMLAIIHAFILIAPSCRNQRVMFETDNESNVGMITSQRSTNAYLRHLLRIIYVCAARYNIHIQAKHIAGDVNHVADWLSRPSKHTNSNVYHDDNLTIDVTYTNSLDLEALLKQTKCLETNQLNCIVPNYLEQRN